MKSASRGVVLHQRPGLLIAVMGSLLLACGSEPDVFDLDNLGRLEVSLSIAGTPGSGGFVAEWRDLDSNMEAGGGINPDIQPKRFEQVPVGPIEVELTELPANCTAAERTMVVNIRSRQTTEVVFDVECTESPEGNPV